MSGDDNKTIKILFFGDMVGKPGRFAVRDFLAQHRAEYDFVIANVENASHGFGLTEKNYNDLISYGIDAMTSGNHIWDKREIFSYIPNAEKLVRPINYPKETPGAGSRIFECGEYKIAVLNVLGKVFINLVDFQWDMIVDEIKRLKEITPIVIVDFHGEATAEKICFGKFCSEFGVSAFLGTHTHVQTADETILNETTGYITDAGFCGAVESVIGMDYKTSLTRFITGIPERYEVAEGNEVQINAVEIDIDVITGCARAIKRIFCSRNNEKEDESQ